MEEKIPPYDLEAEQSVLGSMMISKDAVALALGDVKSEYFYKESHSHIFKAIQSLYRQGEPVDLVTVSAELKKMDSLMDAGGRTSLAEIIECVPTASNVLQYSRLVKEKALLRRLIDAGSNIIGDAFADTQDVEVVLDSAQKQILDISKESVAEDFVKLKDVLNTVFDDIQRTYDNDDHILGVSTGFKDLDQLTSGFQKGDLVILAARPAMGKTTLALNFATYAAITKKLPVAFFSLEMPKEQLAMRLLCSEARLDSKRLRTANLLDHEYKDLNRAFGKLGDSSIYIDDTPSLSPMELRAKCRRLQMEEDVKLIVIDYLQLMRAGKKRIESRFQEISEIVREVKAFAKESKIPILALSQLSRDVEKRSGDDRRPRLSDLRESGEIEQTADLVLFIHRDDYYEQSTSGLSNTKLIIAKQRNGPTGDIDLVFQKDISRFRDKSNEMPPKTS
ncbi:MAG: replicative DNA helicase [bacterium]|nr:replicative DNA helicase [bacterium]